MRRSSLALVLTLRAVITAPPARLIQALDVHGTRLFAADPDSSDLGYLLVAPGVEYEVHIPRSKPGGAGREGAVLPGAKPLNGGMKNFVQISHLSSLRAPLSAFFWG